MTDQELQIILDRVKNTTGGEWVAYIEGRDFTSGSSFIMTGTDSDRGNDIELIGASNADIDFIANAKQDVLHLIEEIHRLKNQ